jgi:hypothetical protein
VVFILLRGSASPSSSVERDCAADDAARSGELQEKREQINAAARASPGDPGSPRER